MRLVPRTRFLGLRVHSYASVKRPYAPIWPRRHIGKLSRNLATIDFGLNLCFMGFTFYLPDLPIGVGLVTGVTVTTHLSNENVVDSLTL